MTLNEAIAAVPVPAFFADQLDAYYRGEYSPEDAAHATAYIDGLRHAYPTLAAQYDAKRTAEQPQPAVSVPVVRYLAEVAA